MMSALLVVAIAILFMLMAILAALLRIERALAGEWEDDEPFEEPVPVERPHLSVVSNDKWAS